MSSLVSAQSVRDLIKCQAMTPVVMTSDASSSEICPQHEP